MKCSLEIKENIIELIQSQLAIYKLSYWLITELTVCSSLLPKSHEIVNGCEPPAIVAHSILEKVRGMSYEVVNVRIRSFSRPISVFCTHPSP